MEGCRPLALLAHNRKGPIGTPGAVESTASRIRHDLGPDFYKSGRKHSDADCLSRAPVELASERTNDADEENVFLCAVNAENITEFQRYDPEPPALIEHMDGRHTTVPRFSLRALPSFVVRRDVLYKENFGDNNTAWLWWSPVVFEKRSFKPVTNTQ